MGNPFHILFLCTGNSCRSPAAEALLKMKLAEKGLDQEVLVQSAGIAAVEGNPASAGTCAAIEKRGASLADFVCRPATAELMQTAHVIFVMEYHHRDALEELFPAVADRVRLLGHFLIPHGPEEIPDPVGATQEYYDQVIDLIEQACDRILGMWQNLRDRYYEKQTLMIALGADHRGFQFKEAVKNFLINQNFQVIDCGTTSDESCDHPDFAFRVAERVSFGFADRGVLLCSSGHGMLISANKVMNVRAIMPLSEEHARMSRIHNNANVITLGADFMHPEDIEKILQVWLETPFAGGRYQQRINKISYYERRLHGLG